MSYKTKLVEKAMNAGIAAIEIYNKPVFNYREESFVILIVNAWDLLLKARILQENNNQQKSITIYEHRTNKNGKKSKAKRIKRNRSGNPMTIGIIEGASVVSQYDKSGIDRGCRENLLLLAEIRDNAIHLTNSMGDLGLKIHGLGTAALTNFSIAAKKWFDVNLDSLNFHLMPLAFQSPAKVVESVVKESQSDALTRLLSTIRTVEAKSDAFAHSEYALTYHVNLSFLRSSKQRDANLTTRWSNDPDALPIQLKDEDVRENYPLDYQELTARMRERYVNFKVNPKYHELRKKLVDDKKYCFKRHLDPNNPSSTSRVFFSPGIFNFLDKHYDRKQE